MNVVTKQDLAEVRLSMRDLFSLCGLAVTIVCALWAFSSDIKTNLVQLSARIGYIEKRVESLEAASSPERTELYRRFMDQMRRVEPTPQAKPGQ